MFTWLSTFAVDRVVVTAAKLAGDSALASSPLAGGTEGAAPQLPLLALPHNTKQCSMHKERYRVRQERVSHCSGGESSRFLAILGINQDLIEIA